MKASSNENVSREELLQVVDGVVEAVGLHEDLVGFPVGRRRQQPGQRGAGDLLRAQRALAQHVRAQIVAYTLYSRIGSVYRSVGRDFSYPDPN